MIEKFLRKLSFFYEAVYCVRCSYLLAQVPIRFEGKIEVVSKPHLRPNSCVASLFKMLTYYRVCCAFSSAYALLLSLI